MVRGPLRCAGARTASGGAAEVLGRDRVEELAELLHLVLLLVRDGDARFFQHVLAGEDDAPVRRARAMESDGRALTSTPLEKTRSAKKMPSRRAVMLTVRSWTSKASSTSRKRS